MVQTEKLPKQHQNDLGLNCSIFFVVIDDSMTRMTRNDSSAAGTAAAAAALTESWRSSLALLGQAHSLRIAMDEVPGLFFRHEMCRFSADESMYINVIGDKVRK